MVFQNKAGLWLLIGIPILILIYIIKSHHEDYPVSSTYIWRLSSKFRKKRLPMQKFRRFLLFAAQLLTIVAVAGIISRPSIANGDSINYIVILDASGSMQTEDSDGATRFDRALDQIAELKDYINEGHTISLITASDTASVVLQDCSSTAEFKRSLKNLTCTYGELSLSDAVALAEKVASESDNSAVLFYTDSDYETSDGVTVVNVNSNEWNACVTGLTYTNIKTAVTTINSNGGKTVTYKVTGTEFTGLIYSENKDATFTVGLKIDGKITDVQEVSVTAGETGQVVFTEDDIKTFDTAEIYIIVSDGLSADNSYCICREQDVTASVLLKSDSPFYLNAVLEALGNCTVTVIGSDEDTPSGYDLYIFDCCTDETLPTDGSVLFINTAASGTVSLKSEVLYESEDESESAPTVSKADTTDMTKRLQGLTDDMSFGENIYVCAYSPIVYGSGWNGILYCGDDCVFAVRQLTTGLTQMVLSFDLHKSNLPMLSDFVYFMRNIIKASLPSIIYETDYTLGESVSCAVLPSTTDLYIEEPSGSVISLAISDSTLTYTPGAAGTYTIIEKNAGGGAYADFFVHLSATESMTPDQGTLSISLNKTVTGVDGSETVVTDTTAKRALTPLWYWFALAALILLLVEWEVYYYEQY